jgi:DNA anti-recombination protein RmuC
MKRYLISAVFVFVVLAVAWVALGQEQSERAQRWARYRQAQTKAIELIQEQAAKLKTALEESARRDWSSWRDLSEEERAKLRERFMKMREERQQALEVIEQQIVRLKGPRRLRTEHEESIAELQAIHELAVKEKATETARHIEELIAKRNETYEETVQELGFGRFRRRR